MRHGIINATPRGFEPLRAEPNGFLVHLLSHSDKVSCLLGHPGFLNQLTATMCYVRAARAAERRFAWPRSSVLAHGRVCRTDFLEQGCAQPLREVLKQVCPHQPHMSARWPFQSERDCAEVAPKAAQGALSHARPKLPRALCRAPGWTSSR